jgi:iron(III) transport system permease protein
VSAAVAGDLHARRARRRLWATGVGLALALLWLAGYPLLVTVWESLRDAGEWTVAGFTAFAERPDEWLALWRSVWISVASVVLSAAVGVPLAFLFERSEFPGRRLLGALVALPVALPPLVGVIAFLFLYGESGFVPRALQALFGLDGSPWRLAGPGAILLVHTYSMYVYFYLFTRAALARMDGAVEEAAASLGAGAWTTLRRVTLPTLGPALAGASLLTFMTSLASFSAPYIFGGGFRVMTTQITSSKLNGDDTAAQVETVVLALAALLGLFVFSRLGGKRAGATSVRGVAPRRRRIASAAGRLGAAAAGWALAAVLLAPHATLALISLVPVGTWTVEALPPVLDLSNWTLLLGDGERLRPLVNSLWMATAATLGALALGLAAARGAATLRGRGRSRVTVSERRLGRLLEGLLSLPWAIPGTVFAIALATTFGVSEPLAGRFVLVGTAWILPLAYLVRSLPLTGRAAVAGVSQLDPALEEAAASLGASKLRTLGRVVLPLVRPAIAAGAGLAFITGLGDFVTSVVLYTLDTRPISIEILSSLRIQELGVAAAYGVILAVISGVAFFLWGEERSGGAA